MARTAIITGSDSGIGKATAVALAQAGCDVGVTWHRDEAGAQGTADEIRASGCRAEVRRLDLLDLGEGVAVIHDLADSLGGLASTSTSRNRAPARTAPPRAGWGCSRR